MIDPTFYQRIGKRAFDLVASAVGLAILVPVLGSVAILIWLADGAPVLFRQHRPGRHGRMFTIFKFRTMSFGKGADDQLLPDAERLTHVGRFLRSTSIDELPELWNVLRGDMSLVGPRPLLPVYLKRYTAKQARRHEIRPGLTGWAQVNGRNAITWDERFQLDVWYVDNYSMGLDLRILVLTLWRVLSRRGISAEGHSTMQEFRGQPKGKRSGS